MRERRAKFPLNFSSIIPVEPEKRNREANARGFQDVRCLAG
jgi:hypothetical protein